jgi:hypothetical protein
VDLPYPVWNRVRASLHDGQREGGDRCCPIWLSIWGVSVKTTGCLPERSLNIFRFSVSKVPYCKPDAARFASFTSAQSKTLLSGASLHNMDRWSSSPKMPTYLHTWDIIKLPQIYCSYCTQWKWQVTRPWDKTYNLDNLPIYKSAMVLQWLMACGEGTINSCNQCNNNIPVAVAPVTGKINSSSSLQLLTDGHPGTLPK